MELYRLANNCNYGDLRDEMIRDCLVVGIKDSTLSQQLQLDTELTLDETGDEQAGSPTPFPTKAVPEHIWKMLQ